MNKLLNYKPKLSVYIRKSNNTVSLKQKQFYVSKIEYDVLKYCDGKKTLPTITYCLSQDYQACVSVQDIYKIITNAEKNGLVE